MSTTADIITTLTARPTTSTTPTPPLTTVTPGTGAPDPIITFAALGVSAVALLACVFVLGVYIAHIQRPATVLRNSLNYLWAFVVFVGILGSIKTLVGRALWYAEGSDYAAGKSFCAFGSAMDSGERVLMALALLAFYVNMYVVRRYDEPFAMRCVKWYALAIFLVTAAVITFTVVTAPDSYEKHGNRCVILVDSIHGSIPLVLPLVIEITIVVVGLVSAFGLLCSRSKVNNASSRRRVWLHVFFMAFLFASRLAMTVSTIVYGMDSEANGDEKKEDDESKKALRYMDEAEEGEEASRLERRWESLLAAGSAHDQLFLQYARVPSAEDASHITTDAMVPCNFWRWGSAANAAANPTPPAPRSSIEDFSLVAEEKENLQLKKKKKAKGLTIHDAPIVLRVMMFINIVFTWALGLIVAAIFFYAECLYLVVRVWCVLGCGTEYDDEDVFEPFLRSGTSYASEAPTSAHQRRGYGDDPDDSLSQSSSRHQRDEEPEECSRAGGSISSPGRGVGGSHLSATYRGHNSGAAALEENLQGYTLSYTIRSSSNFADGEIPS